jgi:hypothetical protein
LSVEREPISEECAVPIVNNKHARVINAGDHVVLLPGNNDVPAEGWEEAKEIKIIQGFLKEGSLVEVSGAAAKASEQKGLGDLTVPEAQKLIDETFDRDLLATWRKADERKGVLEAIDAQLDLIKHAGEDAGAKK